MAKTKEIKELVEKRLSYIKRMNSLENEKSSVTTEIKSIKESLEKLDDIMRDTIEKMGK